MALSSTAVNHPSKPMMLRAAERDALVYKLRLQGLSFGEIGERVGLAGRNSAYKSFTREAERVRSASLDCSMRNRDLDLARVDKLLAAVWSDATAVDDDALDVGPDEPLQVRIAAREAAAARGKQRNEARKRAIELLRHRADLTGSRAPVKQETKVEVGGVLPLVVVPAVASVDDWTNAACLVAGAGALALESHGNE